MSEEPKPTVSHPLFRIVLSVVFFSIVVGLSIAILDAAKDAALEEKKAEDAKIAITKNEIAKRDAAIFAAEFLAGPGNKELADYASRAAPSIRICVWMADIYGKTPSVLMVQQCLPNEAEVVFPITYSDLSYSPILGKPTVGRMPEGDLLSSM